MKELKEDAAKYLVVFDNKTEELVGVVHFRFDVEDDRETIYWYFSLSSLIYYVSYEIQLGPTVRNKGLGKFLMQVLFLTFIKVI